MSFLNLFSTLEISFDENNNIIKSSVFTFSKLFIIRIINESLINFSLSSDKQHVLHSQEDSEMTEIFLT
jgi:hypothetical protein